MISHDSKCIFIHIPKCGGTSLEQVIWPEMRRESDLWGGSINKYQTGQLQHLFASHILQEFGTQIFNSYFKFCIIRNPWDKAISQFHYIKRRKDLMSLIELDQKDTFKIYLEKIKDKHHVQWEKQYKFVLNDNGDLIVDFLGRFENFREDSNYIFERLNIQIDLPHSNATTHSHYSDYYDSESMEMVAELYQQDIHFFGYQFEKI